MRESSPVIARSERHVASESRLVTIVMPAGVLEGTWKASILEECVASIRPGSHVRTCER